MFNKLKKTITKHKKKSIIIAAILTIGLIGVTYAYLGTVVQLPAIQNVLFGSESVDQLTFIEGDPLSLNATLDNFGEGDNDLTTQSTTSAHLIANTGTSTATDFYNVYFEVTNNDYTYSTEERKPEILLNVINPENEEITWNTDLDYVTVTDAVSGESLSGYDITTFYGLINFVSEYEISTNSTDVGTKQDWQVKVTYINLDSNQATNINRNLDADLILTQENLINQSNLILDIASDFSPNSYGWTNQNVTYSVNVIDPSEIGVLSQKYCVDEKICGPQDNITGEKIIVDESGETVLCASAEDSTGANSFDCSAKVKIDKENPIPGEIVVDGVEGDYGWYKGPVTITYTDGTDALSGHDVTVVDVPEVAESTASQIVTLTTYDKAGNSASTSTQIKVDVVPPTISGAQDTGVRTNAEVDLLEGVTCADDLSSKDYCRVSVNPETIDTSTEGSHNVTYTAQDFAGHVTTKTITYTITSDVPIITFTPDDSVINENGWAKTDVEMGIKITDVFDSEMETQKYCIDDAECTPQTTFTTDSVTITENGSNTVCVLAINSNNKSVTSCSEFINIDKTLPQPGTINFIGILGTNDYYTSPVTITSSGSTDSVSDVIATLSHSSYSADTKGTTITLTVTDSAGNKATTTKVLKKDSTAPTIPTYKITRDSLTGTAISNSTVWRNYNIYVSNFSGTDTTSGPNKYQYSSKCTGTVTNDLNSSYSYTTEQNSYYCIRTVDNAGNASSWSSPIYVRIDKTAPVVGTINLTGTLGTNGYYRTNVGITRSGYSDNLSGVKSAVLSHTNITSSTAGTTVTLTTTDNAGNVSTTTKLVKMDKNAPSVPIYTLTRDSVNGTVISNSTAWRNYTIAISNFRSTDVGSGASYYQYSSGCTGAVTARLGSSYTYTNNSNSSYCIRAVDNAGNVSSWSSPFYIKIDKTAPVVGSINVTGTVGLNGWYQSHVKISTSGSSDSLSKLKSATLSRSSINYDTAGTTVTLTVIDNAGNKATKSQLIKIDATGPSIPTVVARYNNAWGALYTSDVKTSSNIYVQLGATDNLSGILRFIEVQAYLPVSQYYANYLPDYQFYQLYTTTQRKSYHFHSQDRAGNVSTPTWPENHPESPPVNPPGDFYWIDIQK